MTDEPVPWLALGIELRLTTTEEGGRSKPLGVDDNYRSLQYRPNWGLPGMTGTEQVGAPVLCFGNFPLALGDRTRAVIIPLVDLSLELWRAVQVGDDLRMFEGPRICGEACVIWTTSTTRPVDQADETRFCAWARGGDPPGM